MISKNSKKIKDFCYHVMNYRFFEGSLFAVGIILLGGMLL